MPEPILLVGGGGHCRSVIEVLETAGWPIAGIVHGPEWPLEPVLGYPALGHDVDLPSLRRKFSSALVTVGQIRTATLRKQLFLQLRALEFILPTLVSPLAHCSRHATLGQGCVVMHQALINAGAMIGENCILNTQCLIEHDAWVGDHCHISTGARLNGGVRVGAESFVGSGSVIRENVSLPAASLTPMGSILFK